MIRDEPGGSARKKEPITSELDIIFGRGGEDGVSGESWEKRREVVD